MRADRIENIYLSLPVGLRQAIPPRVKFAFRNWLLPEWRQARTTGGIDRVGILEKRLWGGFSRAATAELEMIKARAASPKAAAQAAWVLARWHSARGEPEDALANIVYAREVHPPIAAVPARDEVPLPARPRRRGPRPARRAQPRHGLRLLDRADAREHLPRAGRHRR
jgi:hypothetical protein